MIDTLLADAARDPVSKSIPFLVGASESFTYSQADDAMNRLAAHLKREGIKKLACFAGDSPKLALVLLACTRADCEVCVLNRESPVSEIGELLKRFDLTVMVADTAIDVAGIRTIAIDSLFQSTNERLQLDEANDRG